MVESAGMSSREEKKKKTAKTQRELQLSTEGLPSIHQSANQHKYVSKLPKARGKSK